MKRVYLDNAATAPMIQEVIDVQINAFQEFSGNPSSIHSDGRKVKGAIETVRKQIAKSLNVLPSEIIFTSGGTEADNFAIKSAVDQLGVTRIITSKIEHHAVLHSVEYAEEHHGVQIRYVNIDAFGNPDLQHLNQLLKESEEKTLVTLMHVNNELGTLTDLNSIALICEQNKALFHSDTVQSMGYYHFDLSKYKIHFLTCSAHKLHGPKGIGFLYVNKDIQIKPIQHGGSQERGMRGGTENVSGILGMGKAFEIATKEQLLNTEKLLQLKNRLKEGIIQLFPNAKINTPDNSSPAILNCSLPIEKNNSMILFQLDIAGISCSGGSACTSGSLKGSHVLEAINANMNWPAVRFSFSKLNTIEDVEYTLEVLKRFREA